MNAKLSTVAELAEEARMPMRDVIKALRDMEPVLRPLRLRDGSLTPRGAKHYPTDKAMELLQELKLSQQVVK